MPNNKKESNDSPQPSADLKTKKDANVQSVDLSSPGVASMLAKRILEDIDGYCVRTYDGGHRSHLGASLIGHSCKRYLWYLFRWTFREQTDGRKQRLFNRGHREEARFIEWLEGIGVKCFFENYEGFSYRAESDSYCILAEGEEGERLSPENPHFKQHIARAKADGLEFPQYRVSAVMGHFGGSLDGIAILPERYGIKEPVLLEFKTNGTGAGFDKLISEGMAVAKPQHFAQTSTYGSDPAYGFNYVLYLNICKNDDAMHVEVVKLDHNLGRQMREKAEQIILATDAPPRLSDNPTHFDCKFCSAKDICHKGAIPEKNCRSCKKASAVDNAEWFCNEHNGIIPKDFIKQGCSEWVPITTKG